MIYKFYIENMKSLTIKVQMIILPYCATPREIGLSRSGTPTYYPWREMKYLEGSIKPQTRSKPMFDIWRYLPQIDQHINRVFCIDLTCMFQASVSIEWSDVSIDLLWICIFGPPRHVTLWHQPRGHPMTQMESLVFLSWNPEKHWSYVGILKCSKSG